MGPSKLKNHVFLGKYWNLNFQNWSKALFSCLRAIKTIGCQSTAYALRYRQGKQVFVKENEKNMCKGNLNL